MFYMIKLCDFYVLTKENAVDITKTIILIIIISLINEYLYQKTDIRFKTKMVFDF